MTAPGPTLRLHAPDAYAPAVEHALDLWSATRGTPMRREWVSPPGLAPYLFHLYAENGEDLSLEVGATDPWDAQLDTGRLWVAYSGGKDSLAVGLMARERGYSVTLYHVAGMNRSVAAAELDAARAGAAATGLKLVVETVTQSGPRAGYLEVPSKNQVIVALMVARMIAAGAGTYALGTTQADTMIAYLCAYSDTTGAGDLYHGWLESVLPGIRREAFLRHETESIATIASLGYLDVLCGSCMSPIRFRGRNRAHNEIKYGPLLPGRCGSCPKCCWEYLVLDALGYDTPGNGFLEHCLIYLQGQMASLEATKRPLDEVYDYWVRADLVEEHLQAERI